MHTCRCAECGAIWVKPGAQGLEVSSGHTELAPGSRVKLGLNWSAQTHEYRDIEAIESRSDLKPASSNSEIFKNTAAALGQQSRGMAPAAKLSPAVEYKQAEAIEDNHG